MRPKLKRDEVERLRLQFLQVDKNHDGKIDVGEFREFLKETFPYANAKDLEEMTPAILGEDGDAKIDIEQYVDFMSQDVSLRFDVKFIRYQSKIWEDRLGLVTYLPFLALFIFFLVTGKGLGSSYWMQLAVIDHLEGDEFQNTDDLRYYKSYQDIGELEEFWDWNNWPMSNTIWPDDTPPPTGSAPIDLVNYPIGALKLRQIRISPETCSSAVNSILNAGTKNTPLLTKESRLRDYRIYCYPEIAEGTVDESNYPVQTYRMNNSFSATVDGRILLDETHFIDPWERDILYQAYRYRSAADINGTSASFFLGKANSYGAGGYAMIIPFSYGRDTVQRILTTLQDGVQVGGWTDPTTGKAAEVTTIPWVDHATRGISVEFLTYNQNLDLVARYQQFVEVTASGGIIPLHFTITFPFFNLSTHGAGYFTLVVLFILMILIQCYVWLKMVSLGRLRYVMDSGESGFVVHVVGVLSVLTSSFWVMFDFVNLSLFVAAWAIRFYWMSLSFTSTSVLTLDWYPKDWETVGELVVILSHIDAVNALLTFLRVFYFLKLNSQLNLLTKTISKAKVELMGIVFIFLIVFIGFALMAFVVFGTVLEGYRDFSTTVSSLLLMLLGDFDYTELKEQRRVFAPVLFTVFNILANFLLLNMVIAVLNQAFEEVQNSKYDPGKVQVLLETVNQDMTDDPFIEKMSRRQKGLQNWVRGTSLWREMIYFCNIINLYKKSKSELPGGEDEWEARLREAMEYNPRTYWKLQENMIFYQKRSMVFQDKLKVNPMPLKYHLLDEFGDDLPLIMDLRQYTPNASRNHDDFADHDLVISPSYCTGAEPRQSLLEMMDFYHTWKSSMASNYASLSKEDGELIYEEHETNGIAIRGSVETQEFIKKQTLEWRAGWETVKRRGTEPDLDRKMHSMPEEMSRYEKQRRQAEREDYERVFEKMQIDEQTQHIENLQRRLDDMHSAVTGSIHKGAVRIDAKDVLVPSNMRIAGAPCTGELDPNGIYARKGVINGKPYWKKLQLNEVRDENLCIMWGEGRWWVGKPRRHAVDRVCVPSLLTWDDKTTNFPPMGVVNVTDGPVVGHVWEAVMYGGIGNPPELSYEQEPDGSVQEITVERATSHQVNGVYTLQREKMNGKNFWRKRYQPVVRYFKVEPMPGEEERTSVVRSALRGKRDEISEQYNVTLRVPGELAARERRMQLEGDWQMCLQAYQYVIETARDAVDSSVFGDPDVTDDELLPEVFMSNGHEVSEATRLAKVNAIEDCTTPEEWEHTGTGYDIDLMWKAGKWIVSRRLAESSKGYVGFHEMHPKVSVALRVELGDLAPKEAKMKWDAFIKDIPRILARYSREDLLVAGRSVNGDGLRTVDQGDEVFIKVVPRMMKVLGPDGSAADDSCFEDMCAWYKERRNTASGRDALLFGVVFEDDFRKGDNSTVEVCIPTGRLKGTWLECTITGVPVDNTVHAKYQCDVDNKTSLEHSTLVLHREYYKDFVVSSRARKIRTLHVTGEAIRKRAGQDAESWANRFVSWLSDPTHPIHQEYPGLLSAEKILTPSPQSLYFCEDPDTRYHPPLFREPWTTPDGAQHKDIEITATTKVYIKKAGLGGVDVDPMYLALHHAYTVSEWELSEGTAEVYHGANVQQLELDPSGEKWTAPMKIGAVLSGGWLQKYNVQEGLPLGQWVKVTDQWIHQPSKSNEQWTRDFRDENSLYACVHRWKNEAAIWDLVRAPERGTKMFVCKSPVGSRDEPVQTEGKSMLATNYPASYKGDGATRYLSVFGSDRRHKAVQNQKRKQSRFLGMEGECKSYKVCAHVDKEALDEESGMPAGMWEVVLFPKEVPDLRMGANRLWWQDDACIIDWLRHDMYTDQGELTGVPEVPIGTRWSSADEAPIRASERELAPYDELERRVEWYLDNWRLARKDLSDLDDINTDDLVKQKQSKHRLRQLKLIDQEREKQGHKVLIKRPMGGGENSFLSVWRNYPHARYEGMWRSDGLFTRKAEEHHVEQNVTGLVGLLGPDPDAEGEGDNCWRTDMVPEPGGRVKGTVTYKKQTLDCYVAAVSYSVLVVTVEKWREMDLEHSFELVREAGMMRDVNSHFVLATQQYQLETHTTWEIEPIHDLDDTIDYAVREAVSEAQTALQARFRSLIHEEMEILLKTVLPSLLLEELGPSQLVQTLNYKIRAESIAKEENELKGDEETEPDPTSPPPPRPQKDVESRVGEWRDQAEPKPEE